MGAEELGNWLFMFMYERHQGWCAGVTAGYVYCGERHVSSKRRLGSRFQVRTVFPGAIESKISKSNQNPGRVTACLTVRRVDLFVLTPAAAERNGTEQNRTYSTEGDCHSFVTHTGE